jgi:hypothetical protein
MLTELDESIWHQIPSSFDHVGTSDPRFYDRHWFAIYNPAAGLSLQVTLGSYNNLNVLDAGVMVLEGNSQHNLRVSRMLRPRFEPQVGPVTLTIEKPMKAVRLTCGGGEHGFSFDLLWEAALPPEEEKPHYSRLNGRIQEEYQRYNQVGTVSGTLRIGGRSIAVDRWWSARDHSWGIRPGIGGPQPANGEPPPPEASGSLFCFLFFSTSGSAGHVQLAERGGAQSYLTGLIRFARPDQSWAERHVDSAALTLHLVPGTRRPSSVEIAATLDTGAPVRLELQSAGPSFAMPGLGYGGWNDRLGLGVYRGLQYEEHETWDITHPADVVSADGSTARPVHRIQPVRVSLEGEGGHHEGTGSLTLIANGHLPKYGLE